MLPRPDVVALLTAATVFACPSIYEPLGIVNLEAMACETAVVATATGGIPEVVVDGETGWLVPIEQATDGTGTPLDPERYVADLAAALVDAVERPRAARERGAGRPARAQESFSWPAIAEQTLDVYRSLLDLVPRRALMHDRSALGPADVTDEQLTDMVADLLGTDPAETTVVELDAPRRSTTTCPPSRPPGATGCAARPT